MTDPAVTRYDLSESLKKQLAVAVVEKDLLARITPTSQMIDCAGKFNLSGRAMARLYQLICRVEPG